MWSHGAYVLVTVVLLCCSCAVMTTAWYLHLKFTHWNMRQAIVYSWLIAGLEYCLMIPANRIGAQYAEMSPATLRGIAELAILTSFLLFNRFVLKQPALWNHIVGFTVVFLGVLIVLCDSESQTSPLGRVTHCFFGGEKGTASSGAAGLCEAEPLPDSLTMLRLAFPPDTHGGKWAAVYLTKQYDGMEPTLGGYPTGLDVGYPFEYPAPFFGQPGAGTPNHCPMDAPSDVDITSCPKVTTRGDDDVEGPGQIPGDAASEALVRAHRVCDPDLKRWFATSCRIGSTDLLRAIRKVYPREDYPTYAEYPVPQFEEGEGYSLRNLDFPSPQGPPHFCDAIYRTTGMWVDYCPYNPNGTYVHGHLVFTAWQQWLAHKHNPALCGPAWDDSHYPSEPDTSIAFPDMVIAKVPKGDYPKPAVPFAWPGPQGRKRKAVAYPFITRLVMQGQP